MAVKANRGKAGKTQFGTSAPQVCRQLGLEDLGRALAGEF